MQASQGNIRYVESRMSSSRNQKNKDDPEYFDLYMDLTISKDNLLVVMRSLRQGNLAEVTVLSEKLVTIKGQFMDERVIMIMNLMIYQQIPGSRVMFLILISVIIS